MTKRLRLVALALCFAACSRGSANQASATKHKYVVELDVATDAHTKPGDPVQLAEAFKSADKEFAVYEADDRGALTKYLDGVKLAPNKITEVQDINTPMRGGGHATEHPRSDLKTFVIERHIPGVGTFPEERKQASSKKSVAAMAQIGDTIEWEYSYQTAEGTYCIYRAADEETIRRHGSITGSPITKINEVQPIAAGR